MYKDNKVNSAFSELYHHRARARLRCSESAHGIRARTLSKPAHARHGSSPNTNAASTVAWSLDASATRQHHHRRHRPEPLDRSAERVEHSDIGTNTTTSPTTQRQLTTTTRQHADLRRLERLRQADTADGTKVFDTMD